MALLSIQATSPERRFTQKEIIAGEERPKYLLIKQHQDAVSASSGGGTNASTLSAGTFMNTFHSISLYVYKCHLYISTPPHRNGIHKYIHFFCDWLSLCYKCVRNNIMYNNNMQMKHFGRMAMEIRLLRIGKWNSNHSITICSSDTQTHTHTRTKLVRLRSKGKIVWEFSWCKWLAA